jgi:hypothetical protein
MTESEHKTNGDSTFQKIILSSYLGSRQMLLGFILGHPLDLCKTLAQAKPKSSSSNFSLLREINSKDGVRGFYKGGSMNLGRVMLKEAYRSPLRGFVKHFYATSLIPKNVEHKYPDLKNALTGLTMAVIDTFIVSPLERIKVWIMTSEKERHNLLRYFRKKDSELRRHGLADLFRGLRVSFYRSAISWVSFLLIEENVRLNVLNESETRDDLMSIKDQLLIGTICGVLNSALTLPLDAVKTQIQKRASETHAKDEIMQTCKQIWSKHGLKGFYSGFQYRLPHYIIIAVLTTGNIQKIDKLWKDGSTESNGK